MLQVKFSNPEEFVEELRQEASAIEDSVVRLTTRYTPSRGNPGIEHATVVATAYVGDRGGRTPRLLTLERFVGDLWGENFAHVDKPTLERREAVYDAIEEVAADLHLHLRAGVYEEGD